MTDDKTSRTTQETTPQEFPEVKTPTYPEVVGSAYVVECIMQMQSTLGELRSEVQNLKTTNEKQTSTLNRISHIIYAAGAVLFVVLGIGGFVLDKIWAGMITLMSSAQ